jgi:hypothetical protein
VAIDLDDGAQERSMGRDEPAIVIGNQADRVPGARF